MRIPSHPGVKSVRPTWAGCDRKWSTRTKLRERGCRRQSVKMKKAVRTESVRTAFCAHGAYGKMPSSR